MITTDAFKDKKLIIFIGDSDNKMTIPLDQIKGNIGNIINFIIYAFMNSGIDWEDIYQELSNFVHRKIDNIEFENRIKCNKENVIKNIFEVQK